MKKISLALQGGGSHGAMTWGVLDRLLEEPYLEIEAISATSAGAINAALLMSGLAIGGAAQAKDKLERYWQEISQMTALLPLRPNFFEKMINLSSMTVLPFFQTTEWFRHIFAPYQFNFFDVHPLADLLDMLIEYQHIKNNQIKLFVNATNVKTGEAKIFTNRDISDSKKLVASACLPYMAQNVRIGEDYYWDGSFSGNPLITPLIDFTETQEIILVKILPSIIDEVPKSIPEIIDRADEIQTNSQLYNEIKYINLINQLIISKKIKSDKYRLVNIHTISNDEVMSTNQRSSKMNADLDFLLYLKDIGRQSAEDWLNAVKVGK